MAQAADADGGSRSERALRAAFQHRLVRGNLLLVVENVVDNAEAGRRSSGCARGHAHLPSVAIWRSSNSGEVRKAAPVGQAFTQRALPS